jgi:hypothetical protein
MPGRKIRRRRAAGAMISVTTTIAKGSQTNSIASREFSMTTE